MDARGSAATGGWVTWTTLPLLVAGKQLLAVLLVWAAGTGSHDPFGQSMGRRDLLGQFVFALLTGIAIMALARLRAWRRPFAALLLFSVLLSLVLLADVLYARQFGAPLGVEMLRHASRFPAIAGAAFALLRPVDLLLFADLPFLVLFRGRILRALPAAPMAPARVAGVLGLCVAGFAAALITWPGRSFLGQAGVSWRVGLVDYHAVDLARTAWWHLRRPRPPEGVRERLIADVGARSGDAASGWLQGTAPGASVVVLQLESLQSFVFGLEVAGVPLTPNLDRLARESIVVREFFHTTGLGVSSDADLAVNCSLLPSPDRAVSISYEDNAFHCLPELLAGAGYHTAALQSLRVDMWNASRTYRAYGYAETLLQGAYVRDEPVGMGLSDASFLRQSLDKLEAMPRPFLAFLVTLSSHAPFVQGDPVPGGRWPDDQVRRYAEAIRYTDRQVGMFIDGLERRALLDDVVLVVYGDHHGVQWSEGAADWLGLPGDELSRVLFTRQVPLLIRLPGGALARTVEEVASQVDLAPTIAAILGLPTGGALFQGRAVGSPSAMAAVFPNGDAIDRDTLLLARGGTGGAPSCIDRASRAELPDAACSGLAGRAAADLERSREILEYDLHEAAVRKP